MKKRLCSVEGCCRWHVAKGFCSYHYDKLKRAGLLFTSTPICTIEGCDKPLHCKGMCMKHYRQKIRTGSHLPSRKQPQIEAY